MRTYFFDLDGTLSDSRAGLYLSFRAALAEIGAQSRDDDALAAFLGTPLPDLFRAVVPGIGGAAIARGMAAFRAAYEADGILVNALYPGVDGMLDDLAEAGRGAWIVTSKPEVYARQIAARLGLETRLAGVIGAGLDETDTKQTLIARALAQSATAPDGALMLGDRRYDVAGARANGVLAVGALWGYGTRAELEDAGCVHFAADVMAFRHTYIG